MNELVRVVILDLTGVLKRVRRSWRNEFTDLKDACIKYELIGRVLEEDDHGILLSPLNSLDVDDPYMIPFIIPKALVVDKEKLCKKKQKEMKDT